MKYSTNRSFRVKEECGGGKGVGGSAVLGVAWGIRLSSLWVGIDGCELGMVRLMALREVLEWGDEVDWMDRSNRLWGFGDEEMFVRECYGEG